MDHGGGCDHIYIYVPDTFRDYSTGLFTMPI